MRIKRGPIGAVVAAGLLIAVAACGSDASTPAQRGKPAATPNIQATITALAQGAQVGTPTPTAVPAGARTAAQEFAHGNQAISERWEKFHSDFDGWREGLVACSPGSVQAALGGFAGRFAEVTESARSLPRAAVVRALSDKLIQAAEQEEKALRLLRDTWQPGLTTIAPASGEVSRKAASGESNGSKSLATASPFEGVDIARSSASILRQEVADALGDWAEKTKPSSLAEVDAFAALFRKLEASWDQFHLDYDALGSQSGGLASDQTVAGIGGLVDQFRNIVGAVRGLPTTIASHEVAQILAQAAQEEDLSLRKLRGTIQIAAANPESQIRTAFDAFDTQLVASNAARLQAKQKLALVLNDVSRDTAGLVAEFTKQYNFLLLDWDDFHKKYDEWRRTEGGCNRSAAIEKLGQFTVTFSKIASDTRDLPAAAVLRPMVEILVEAAEREERALRELRNTWHPYDAEVYKTMDQERRLAGKLRRQVAVGIRELFERFGIPPQ